MRQLLRDLASAALVLLCGIARASAQQGTLQLSTAAQALTGDRARIGTERTLEPDAGVSWLQPGSRFGTFQIELRGIRRGDALHLGRAYLGLRGYKARGLTWSFEAGDAFFAPAVTAYKFSNLSTPTVTFAGVAVSARSALTDLSFVAGRTTAWRNVFGTDPETLDQDVAMARARRTVSSHLELHARASRIRTGENSEFGVSAAASDQIGAGARLTIVPAVQVVADGSYVSYRRRRNDPPQRDGSGLAGMHVLLGRGWIQANVSRFSPGDLPVINQPLADRQTFFAAGEYDVALRWRAFGGVEGFRTNLDARADAGSPPLTDGVRGFGGVRTQVGSHGTMALRLEQGDRRTRYLSLERTASSDSGSASLEWQTTAGPLTSFARYTRRANVELANADASYTQHDAAFQLFARASRSLQLFGTLNATRSLAESGAGSTYWQAGGGAQGQIGSRGLWLRGEATTSQNLDRLTQTLVPRDAIMLGINGEVARNTMLGLNVYADHVSGGTPRQDSWVARSTLRLTRSFATGAVRLPNAESAVAARGGTGSIIGSVFRDWNADGHPDEGEDALEGIPVRLGVLGSATTSRDGGFAFVNVPAGLQSVGLDIRALPVDFDPPFVFELQLELARGETHRVAFGLIPLGTIRGRVIKDDNRNGRVDPGEAPVEGAVLVLDGGARSEQVRKGQFKFEAVRSGEHALELLPDSLPEGGTITGAPRVTVALGREHLTADVVYLVTVQTRPEIRRVFNAPAREKPPRGSSPRPEPDTARTAAGRRPPTAYAAATPVGDDQFAIQIMALNDPLRARALVKELTDAGYRAYLISPDAAEPDAPYRVRVGKFTSQEAARKAAAALEKLRGEKLWVIREPRAR